MAESSRTFPSAASAVTFCGGECMSSATTVDSPSVDDPPRGRPLPRLMALVVALLIAVGALLSAAPPAHAGSKGVGCEIGNGLPRCLQLGRRRSSGCGLRPLTKEEVDLVLQMIPEGVYRRYAAALAYTGGRAGEATAARVVDVDLPARVIRVRRSISPGRHGELIEQTPKSHKWRPVPIVDDFVPYVKEAMAGKKPQERLFAGKRGGRLTNKTFVRAVNWPKIREALHRPDFKVKDLRHTFATLLFDAGVSAPDVQQAMGHSSLQVTELYSRSRDNATAGTGRRLSAFLRGSQTPGSSPSTQDAPARSDPPSL